MSQRYYTMVGTRLGEVSKSKEEILNKLAKTHPNLVKKLQKLDHARAEKIDAKNRRRLIRAIEIAHALGKIPAPQKTIFYNALKIGITLPPEQLKERIKKRLAARMKKGMGAEVRKLHDGGIPWKRMEALGLEYRFLARYLQKKITKTEILTQLETAIWRYAKRQMTWWKRDEEIRWYVPNESDSIQDAVRGFLQE